MADDPPFERRWLPRRMLALRREARRAEWQVPEGRIGNLVRHVRARAHSAVARATIFLWTLVVVVAILFYVVVPFLGEQVEGERQALTATLDAVATRPDALTERRTDLHTRLVATL